MFIKIDIEGDELIVMKKLVDVLKHLRLPVYVELVALTKADSSRLISDQGYFFDLWKMTVLDYCISEIPCYIE